MAMVAPSKKRQRHQQQRRSEDGQHWKEQIPGNHNCSAERETVLLPWGRGRCQPNALQRGHDRSDKDIQSEDETIQMGSRHG